MKKFEVRGVRCPYSDVATKKSFHKQPTEWFMMMSIHPTSGDAHAWANIIFGFAENKIFDRTRLGGFSRGGAYHDRIALSSWKLKPVEKFQIDIDNEEWERTQGTLPASASEALVNRLS